MTYELQGIKINCADGISQEEAAIYLDNQLQVMPHKTLLSLDLGLDGNDIIVKPHYDTIVRVPRSYRPGLFCVHLFAKMSKHVR